MNGVQDVNFKLVACELQIPNSKQNEINQLYNSVPDRKRAHMHYFLAHHPAPSWKHIAVSMWRAKELGALEVVQKLYFKGKPDEHYV